MTPQMILTLLVIAVMFGVSALIAATSFACWVRKWQPPLIDIYNDIYTPKGDDTDSGDEWKKGNG
jgi:hypothetical protein